LQVDSTEIFHAQFDAFSFHETRCVNAYMHYESKLKSGKKIHQCIVPENNMIGIFKAHQDRGFYYFNEEQWRKDIKHIEFPERYSCTAYSPNTSFLYFKNLKVVEEYVDWHMKMVKTNGEEIPEWFWLATDQGILGHVIREGDYTTSTITDKIFLADSDYGTKETRRIGMSEQWYWPKDADHSKDDFIWEHVWLAKIVYGWDPDFMARETQRYFDECWAFGGQKYLMHYKLSKYWDENKHAEQ
jgi:hypothetical protein